MLLGVAEAIRIRRERAIEAVRIREEEALRRASEERLRIARELHDALGHQLSLISVQSGVALHLSEELSEPGRAAPSSPSRGQQGGALPELRSVLDILRQEGEQAPRSPTSSLARLDDLVSQAAAAGLDVRTEIDGVVRPLPFGVDVAAFRHRSGGPDERHSACRAGHGDGPPPLRGADLTVQIDNDGRGDKGTAHKGSGTGIVGMRERVAALGGDLEVGLRPGGGFRVRARFPLDGRR